MTHRREPGRILRVTSVAAALVAPVVLSIAATAFAGTDRATAESLLRDSGMWKALGEVVDQVESSLHETIANLPKRPEEAEIRRVERLVDTAYGPDELRDVARGILEEQVSAQDVPGLQQWFASPCGRAIAKAEAAGSWKKETLQKQRREGAVLLEQMPASRRKVLDGVLSAGRAIEINATIAIRSLPTLLAAIARAHPELPIPAEKDLLERFESARPQIERSLYANAIEIYASVYKSVSDSDLEQYRVLLTSAAGRRFTDVLGNAAEAAVLHGIGRFGREIVPSNSEQKA